MVTSMSDAIIVALISGIASIVGATLQRKKR
jgi:hypothetical protein